MNSIRTIFKLIGAVWLIAILVIGIGGTWLGRNPEAAAVYALGTMNVDPKAGVVGQAGQLAQGVAAAHDGMKAMREMERDRRTERDLDDARRRYEEARDAGWGHEAAARSAGLPAEEAPAISIE